jgi:dGTPase
MARIREEIEQRESEWLSPFASHAGRSVGRQEQEAPDPIRTAYQRDRDRILHSKAFRRLKHKTQVFIDPRGDHYRTRMTHTLEVAQIARTIGRALRLNEDLIEAIALAHDLGHSPFGHAGESALDACLQDRQDSQGPHRCRHYEQSLRIVDILEPMNLTEETRLGISGHSKGRADLSDADGDRVSTLEAAVVRVSDRIAYLNHDLDDALRAGVIQQIPDEFMLIGDTHGRRISALVTDVVEQSINVPSIRFSRPVLEKVNRLKEWLFEQVYMKYPILFPEIGKAQHVVKALFEHFSPPMGGASLPTTQHAVDYVAGMTDRFAVDTYMALNVPKAWREES